MHNVKHGGRESRLAGVILAAGLGTRMRPLTDKTPKALLPIGGRPLLDLAIERIALPEVDIAVNVHHHAEQIASHLKGRPVHLSWEETLLASAGAIGNLRGWVGGRAVVIHNADVWTNGSLDILFDGWDRRRPRVLVAETNEPSDFGTMRFLGISLLPAIQAELLEASPSGLYDLIWAPAFEDGTLELVEAPFDVIDCGTPADYQVAQNLALKRGRDPR